MQARVWGCRGSLSVSGPETVRYGGNTSCIEVRLDSGPTLVLDAGTGIRDLGTALQEWHAQKGLGHPSAEPVPSSRTRMSASRRPGPREDDPNVLHGPQRARSRQGPSLRLVSGQMQKLTDTATGKSLDAIRRVRSGIRDRLGEDDAAAWN